MLEKTMIGGVEVQYSDDQHKVKAFLDAAAPALKTQSDLLDRLRNPRAVDQSMIVIFNDENDLYICFYTDNEVDPGYGLMCLTDFPQKGEQRRMLQEHYWQLFQQTGWNVFEGLYLQLREFNEMIRRHGGTTLPSGVESLTHLRLKFNQN
jgi:hypothetical protein